MATVCRRQRLTIPAVIAVMAVLAMAAAACTGGASGAARQARVAAARLAITPADGSIHIQPGQAVTVTATHGKITNVVLVGKGSNSISGALNAARTSWHSTEPLRLSTHYTVIATVVGASHKATTTTAAFRTATPRAFVHAQTLLGDGQVYGVGIPITINFDHPVRYKAAVEHAIEVWSSRPVAGAWYWDGNESVNFRTRDYWPQNTKVRFVAHLAGLQVAPGVYGKTDLSQSFKVGRSLIAVANTATHYVKIYYRNKLYGNWPMSSGAPGDDTADGTYLTIEKGNPVLMSGPGYTNDPVPYAVRFTWSGDYMHDAYWSVGEQGYANVSHGCINLSPEDATIYYNWAVPGDPVTITHSPAAGIWDDGWTAWFLDWNQVLHRSATHLAVQAGPSGSTLVSPSSLPADTAQGPLETSRPGNSRAQ